MLSVQFLILLAAIALLLIVFAPFYSLILLDLSLIHVVEPWVLGGSFFDPADLVVASIAVAILIRGRFSLPALLSSIPYLFLWLALGVTISLSYLAAPDNAENLSNPVRVVYQLYRYCWKGLLYYPICLLVLHNLKQARIVLTACLVGADVCALQAIHQGYAGAREPAGPFVTGNGLAAVLIVPILVALSGVMFPTSRRYWIFSGVSFLLIARAVLFSASRGGMVSMMAGAGMLAGLAFLLPSGRRRIIRLIPLAALAPLLLLIRPDLMDRPTVQHAMTLTKGTQAANMQWRIKERWPHFFNIALENPLLGSGSAIDESLGKVANTPHNGYIALAAKYGFVVTALFLFFLYRVMRDCLVAYRKSAVFRERIFYLTLAAASLGLITNNIVETTWTDPIIQKLFWMMCAFGASYTHLWESSSAGAERELILPSPDRQPSLAQVRQFT